MIEQRLESPFFTSDLKLEGSKIEMRCRYELFQNLNFIHLNLELVGTCTACACEGCERTSNLITVLIISCSALIFLKQRTKIKCVAFCGYMTAENVKITKL